MLAFPQLVGGKAIAVGGEGLYDGLEAVGGVEPCLGVEVLFHAFDLLVNGFGDEEVGAVPEVFYEACGAEEVGGCGDEGECAYAGGD